MVEKRSLSEAKKGAIIGLGIKDVPLWAVKAFTKPAKELYKDDYCTRLIVLLEKEKELETLRTAIDNGIIQVKEDGN